MPTLLWQRRLNWRCDDAQSFSLSLRRLVRFVFPYEVSLALCPYLKFLNVRCWETFGGVDWTYVAMLNAILFSQPIFVPTWSFKFEMMRNLWRWRLADAVRCFMFWAHHLAGSLLCVKSSQPCNVLAYVKFEIKAIVTWRVNIKADDWSEFSLCKTGMRDDWNEKGFCAYETDVSTVL